MRVQTETLSGFTLRIKLFGELDHHAAADTVRRIEGEIDSRLPRETILDFGGVSFMDSSGIAVIIKAKRRAGSVGGTLYIENAGERIRRVLTAGGINLSNYTDRREGA